LRRLPNTCLAIAAVLVAGAACTAEDERPASPTPSAQQAVLALLADRTLVQIAPDSAEVVARAELGPPLPLAASGRFLALSRDRRRLFVLIPAAPGRAQEVRVLDVATLRPVLRFALPEGVVFRAIAVGARTGRFYLFGNRPSKGRTEDAVVTVVGPTGADAQTTTVRATKGYDWWIIDGAVAHDESRIYVSYHGAETTGADWLEVDGDALERCTVRNGPGNGCLARVHGGVEALDSGVLAATGRGPVLEISRSGRVVATRRLRLPEPWRNHVMEIALDPQRERAYALGPCEYEGGGVSIIELTTGRTELLTPDVCGEAIAADADMVVVAERYNASVLGAPSRIALVDRRSGSARYAKLPLEAVDILVVPRS
jgi:hypothetical protein